MTGRDVTDREMTGRDTDRDVTGRTGHPRAVRSRPA